MTTTADAPDTRAQATWSGWPRRIGVVLLLGWVLLLASVPFFGERTSSLDSLEDAAASGDVDVVHASGGLGASGTGYATLELRWRDGVFRYVAVVRETRGRNRGPQGTWTSTTHNHDDPPRVRAGVAQRLEETYPDLRVEIDGVDTQTFTGELFGWRLPGWLAGCGFFLTLGTLLLLIGGPQPWRATKWAWFWLSGIAPPLGQLAYLVAGGPTPLSRAPHDGASRLTGGWAFLLAVLVVPILALLVTMLG